MHVGFHFTCTCGFTSLHVWFHVTAHVVLLHLRIHAPPNIAILTLYDQANRQVRWLDPASWKRITVQLQRREDMMSQCGHSTRSITAPNILGHIWNTHSAITVARTKVLHLSILWFIYYDCKHLRILLRAHQLRKLTQCMLKSSLISTSHAAFCLLCSSLTMLNSIFHFIN